MKVTVLLLVLVSVFLVGCQGEDTGVAGDEASTSVTEGGATSASAPGQKDGENAVSAGMEMADVKKIKGTPDETRHEHGTDGEEVDIWVYGTEEVRFVDGKVGE